MIRPGFRVICILLLFFLTVCLDSNEVTGAGRADGIQEDSQFDLDKYLAEFYSQISKDASSEKCTEMYEYLSAYLGSNTDLAIPVRALVNRYLAGYAVRNNLNEEAERFYLESINNYLAADILDTVGYSTSLASLGHTYMQMGREDMGIACLEESLELREKYYGVDSPMVLRTLVNLSAAYLGSSEFEKARESALSGIEINEKTGIGNEHLGALYYNLGSYYSTRGDYNNAETLFQAAEDNQLRYDQDDINKILAIYNGFGVVCNMVNDTLKAIANYEKILGVVESPGTRVLEGPVYYSNYGHFLGKIGRYGESKKIFDRAMDYCLNIYGLDSEEYIMAKSDLAFYYMRYRDDFDKSLEVYREIENSISKGNISLSVSNEIKRDLADLMVEKSRADRAIALYDEIFESGEYFNNLSRIYNYTGRSAAYREKFISSNSHDDLVQAIDDLERAIVIFDSVKLDFSGEESRLQFASRFNYIWENAIWLASEHYNFHKEKIYLGDAFMYSERSKASTLLSATREISAMEFHLPPRLVQIEKSLDHMIEELSNKIYTENSSGAPDQAIIDSYEQERTAAVLRRDSLISIFESDYPDYFRLKHNNKVVSCREVKSFIGRESDFIEYYLSDTLLYTFIINNNGCNFITKRVDSLTRAVIYEFRNDITTPAIESGAREQFNRIVDNGYYLYKLLVEPVKPYLSSNKLIIAADDILSYIPFEALPSDTSGVKELMYRDVDFLFKDYEITYTYSASLLIGTRGRGKSLTNRSLVFAPSYSGKYYNTDSLLLSRQMVHGRLNDIPGAKEEAIYISNLLGGELYLDNLATEQRFISESSGKDIIHLAMHTLLNDREPMLSKMVFSFNETDIEDGLLNTYEIYNLDLDAKMVVLSSCNTGSGFLQSGEGVISLARGFMYAGTPSIVMALWEVDDLSASEILKSFYRNLKHGCSKSESLKKARRKYLKSADQLRSHPYFWCSLVVMGNDEPIYYKRLTSYLFIILLLSLVYAFRRFRRHTPRNRYNQDQP